MLPGGKVLTAAARWLRLLRHSSLSQASGIIRANAEYTDLTWTQYSLGLEWLRSTNFLLENSDGLELESSVKTLPETQAHQVLFERTLEAAAPVWLRDADLLVPDPAEIPGDAASHAEALGLTESAAFTALQHAHGKVDTAERARVGAAGELELIALLDERWPGSTNHVALRDDGFGYDVLLQIRAFEWHLEIKATTRRGRLALYLSRHEHEVSQIDRNWRLVVVGLDENLNIQALATARYEQVAARSPRDSCTDAKWQTVSHQLQPQDLEPGCPFLTAALGGEADSSILFTGRSSSSISFAWMP